MPKHLAFAPASRTELLLLVSILTNDETLIVPRAIMVSG
jgi:hypothetical protein